MNRILIVLFVTLAIFLSLGYCLATTGVGIGTGKIEINQPIKPGGLYALPVMSVFNNGDENTQYEVAVTYNQDQTQEKPDKSWFTFSPNKFYLTPEASQTVGITLTAPIGAKPGEYFAYLEAHPIIPSEGQTTVGIAAAAKLYFSITPANVWEGIYYRVVSIIAHYAPLSYILSSFIAAVIFILVFRKYFKFSIGIVRK